MATGNPYISAPVSRFQRTTPSASFIKNQLNQQMNQSLIAEAKSRVPDATALFEQIEGMSLHAGDKQQLTQQIQQNLQGFNEGFSENPFYAFSKQGRNQVSAVSGAINNPLNAQLTQRKIEDDEALKIASDNGLIGNLQVNGNQVKVIDQETGRSDWININAWQNNKSRFKAVTVGEDYGYTSQIGVARGARKFSVNMNEYDDILTRVTDVLDKVGETGKTGFNESAQILEKIKTTTNASQINKAYRFLLNNGLSNQDMNTLISNYLATHNGASYEEAKFGVMQSIGDLKDSKTSFDQDISRKENPLLTAAGTEAGIKGTTAIHPTDRIIIGDQQTDAFVFKGTEGDIESDLSGTSYATRASNLGGVIHFGNRGATITNDDGDKLPNMELNKNAAVQQLVTVGLTSGNLKYIDGQGKLQGVPNDLVRNSLIYNVGESTPKLIKHLEDNQGKMASLDDMKAMTAYQNFSQSEIEAGRPQPAIPSVLSKYFVNSEGGKVANYSDYLTFVNLTQLTDNPSVGDKTVDEMRDSKIKIAGDNTESAVTAQIYDYYKDHSVQDPDKGFFGGIDDDVAMTDIIVKVPDMNLFRVNLGGSAFVPKADLQTQSYFDRNYQFFVPDSSLSTNSKIPSRVQSKNLTSFPKN